MQKPPIIDLTSLIQLYKRSLYLLCNLFIEIKIYITLKIKCIIFSINCDSVLNHKDENYLQLPKIKTMSIDSLWTAGGFVSIPLLLFSLLAVALIVERIVFWLSIKRKQRRVVKEVFSAYRSNPIDAIAKLKRNARLPISRIFLEALELEQPTPEEFRLALDSAAQAELPGLRKFSTWFQTIITTSPLLGLLGTILGLIRSFSSIELGNMAGTNSAGVTGGLSEALVSTVMGLIVAIITLLFANAFRGLYLRELALIQEYGGQLELLYRRFHQEVREYASYK